MIKIRLFSIITIIYISGCATLISGSDEEISFTSDPPNIKVYMDTRFIGKTPVKVTVKRVGFATGRQADFRFEREGYRAQQFKLTTEFNNTAFLNTISISSYLTDAFSGAITQYSPTDYHIILEKSDQEEDSKTFHRRSMVQSYVLTSYYELEENVMLGKGDHIDSLLILLDIDQELRGNFVALLKSEMLVSKSPSEFLIDFNQALKGSVYFKSNTFM